MEARERLADYLQRYGAEFTIEDHRQTFTAQETAQAEHVSGEIFVKVVMVEADGRLVMLCLPAAYEVDLEAAAAALGADEVELAAEDEFADRFEDCEVGAMPPFGNLYDVPVSIDESLTRDEEIVFNAGSHTEAMRMRFDDYQRIVEPEVASFGRHL